MRFLPGLTLAACLLVTTLSAAEPVPVTAGVIGFTDEPGVFQISGGGFDVNLGWAPTVIDGTFWFDRCATGCAAGGTVDFGTTTYGFSPNFQGIGGSVNGVFYPELYSTGALTFAGPQVVLMSTVAEPFVARARGVFTFLGHVSLFADAARTLPVFSTELRGSGIAHVFAEAGPSGAAFTVWDIDYAFGAPVPEPSTLLLFGSGLAAGVSAIRRRRTRATPATAPPSSGAR